MSDAERPIFIVGCPRSGTTLLRLILDSHSRIACGPETQFLGDLEKIVGRRWPQMQLFGFDKDYWYAQIRTFFSQFQADYIARRNKQRWAEKSPTYALHMQFINSVFPDCQFLHIVRDPYDVVASHKDRWGYNSALTCAYETWRQYVTAARAVGESLPAPRYLELRYEQLVQNPESSLRGVFEFLDEPWEPGVLDYLASDHDVGAGHLARIAERRAAGNDQSAIYTSRVGAGRRELDPILKSVLRVRNASLMAELGYA